MQRKINHSFNYHKISRYKIGTKKEKEILRVWNIVVIIHDRWVPMEITHLLNFVGVMQIPEFLALRISSLDGNKLLCDGCDPLLSLECYQKMDVRVSSCRNNIMLASSPNK